MKWEKWKYDYATVIMGEYRSIEVAGVHFKRDCPSISYRATQMNTSIVLNASQTLQALPPP